MTVRGDAVGALLAALLCCGTWPAALQLAGAERHSTLVYLDYSAAYPKSDGYCAFGRVVSGMDVVYAISKAATHTYDGWSDVPKTTVVVASMARATC